MDVGAIDRARILSGWTRRDLAQQAHVDEGTLCDLFAGRRRPTFGTLRAICRALALSLEDVIAFEPARVSAPAEMGDREPTERRLRLPCFRAIP